MQDREGFENVISKLKMLETAPAPADLTSRVMGRIEKAEAPGRGLAGIPIRQRFDLFIEYIRAGAAGSLEGELAVFTWLV
ncbi:MAG: hypothetical protein KKB20_06610, partial [Proteobacteria bacterium]|nr:hypothetical protein [Pseudomonadota bacterium]